MRAQSHLAWDGSDNIGIRKQFVEEKTWEENSSRFTRLTYRINGKELTSVTRRDKELDTVWTIEHLLKNTDDVELYLQLPDEIFDEKIDISHMADQEKILGLKQGIIIVIPKIHCVRLQLFSVWRISRFLLLQSRNYVINFWRNMQNIFTKELQLPHTYSQAGCGGSMVLNTQPNHFFLCNSLRNMLSDIQVRW